MDEDEIAFKAKQAADAKAKKELAEKAKGKGTSPTVVGARGGLRTDRCNRSHEYRRTGH
jgi:hypothetical protein